MFQSRFAAPGESKSLSLTVKIEEEANKKNKQKQPSLALSLSTKLLPKVPSFFLIPSRSPLLSLQSLIKSRIFFHNSWFAPFRIGRQLLSCLDAHGLLFCMQHAKWSPRYAKGPRC
jgi:hypothetical protein